jgi:2-iminobutanoate/2-iminopropanoate deaminase
MSVSRGASASAKSLLHLRNRAAATKYSAQGRYTFRGLNMSKPKITVWPSCLAIASLVIAAPALPAQYLEGSADQREYAYSPAVTTEGGRTIWLAGQTTLEDLKGKPIAGDFDAQARTVFQLLDKTLRRTGGSLANLVTMTVFINDPRNVERFVKIRKEFFPDGHYPASALLTISAFAAPGMLIEIQGVAVVGEGSSIAASPRSNSR